MTASLLAALLWRFAPLWQALLHRPQPFVGSGSVIFSKTALATTAITTLTWVAVTLWTRPEPQETLEAFYRKVRPNVNGWQPIARRAPDIPETHGLKRDLLLWAVGCTMVYAALFGTGKLLLGSWRLGFALLVIAMACIAFMVRELQRYTEASIAE